MGFEMQDTTIDVQPTNQEEMMEADSSVENKRNPGTIESMYDLLGEQTHNEEFYQNGGLGQPSEFFTSNEQLQREKERIFHRSWVAVDHISRLRDPGQFTTVQVGDDSILLVRSESGLRGFHNFCRHRGLQLVEEPHGCKSKIVCPYHHWVYNQNGALTKSFGTYLDHTFDPADYGLIPVHTQVRYGVVFVCLGKEPPSLDEYLGDFPIFAQRYELAALQCMVHKDYTVASNWKLIVHNINECLHFPAAHKDLHRVTDFDDAAFYKLNGHILGAWQKIREGFNSVSMGGVSSRRPLSGVPPKDLDLINWVTILPNLLVGFTSDYVMFQWAWPVAPNRSLVRHFWLFHPDEVANPDFTYEEVFALWDKANYEDWELCERCHRGLENRGWTPGPYALDEEVLYDFDRYIVEATSD